MNQSEFFTSSFRCALGFLDELSEWILASKRHSPEQNCECKLLRILYIRCGKQRGKPKRTVSFWMQNTGCRPLTSMEFDAIIAALNGRFRTRNKALFTLARYTGYRISELLAMRIGDVWDGKMMRTSVTVSRENMKGKRFSRSMPLHRSATETIYFWIKEAEMTAPDCERKPLFPSRKGAASMTAISAWRILHQAANWAGISTERLGTHSFRKQFATTMWLSPFVNRDMAKMSRLLGHAHFSSTIRYLQFVDGSLESAVLAA